MKGLRVTKIVLEIKFEGFWVELESKTKTSFWQEDWALGYHSMKFSRSATRESTRFTCASFHLW